MDTLLSAAHLRREIGEALFNALMSSDHTGKVREFAEKLLVPTEIIIGGRTYEVLSFFKEGEVGVDGNVMAIRVKGLEALLASEEIEHILKHQADIPNGIRSGVTFVLSIQDTAYLSRDVPITVGCLSWLKSDACWNLHWRGLAGKWSRHSRVLRVLRRKS